MPPTSGTGTAAGRVAVAAPLVGLARSALFFLALAATTTDLSAGNVTLWDDIESHPWIGEDWGGSQVSATERAIDIACLV